MLMRGRQTWSTTTKIFLNENLRLKYIWGFLNSRKLKYRDCVQSKGCGDRLMCL